MSGYESTTVFFALEGIVPLKMDRFHGLPEPKNDEGYRKQADAKTYRNEEGYVSLPTTAIKACMRFASKEIGARKDTKRNQQTIRAGVFFDEEYLPMLLPVWDKEGRKRKDVPPEKRKVPDGFAQDLITRGTGDKVTRVQTYRPLIKKEWYVEGVMHLYMLTPEFAEQCLDLGGVRYGLLGHRPEFGRFFVKKFQVVKEKA